MKKYQIGIIGAGMIAEKHASGLLKTGRVDLKWVARNNADLLPSFQNKYGISRGTTDYHDILNDTLVDAVVITSPPVLHCQMFLEALAAGKYVLLEKPMAISRDELVKMVNAQKKYPHLKVLECSCRHSRLQPKYKFVKELIHSGKLGSVYYIHHNSVAMQSRPGIEYHPSAKWFLDKSQAGGGPLMDWGVYDLSFHLGLLDDSAQLKSVTPFFIKDKLDNKDPGSEIYDVEEHFAARLLFDNGLNYYWERAAHANMEAVNETRIYGTKGGVRLSFCTWNSNVIEIFGVDDDGKGQSYRRTVEIDVSQQNDDDELSKHFVEVLDGTVEPAMSLELAARHLDIILKVNDL